MPPPLLVSLVIGALGGVVAGLMVRAFWLVLLGCVLGGISYGAFVLMCGGRDALRASWTAWWRSPEREARRSSLRAIRDAPKLARERERLLAALRRDPNMPALRDWTDYVDWVNREGRWREVPAREEA
jgi:hypothetical protein